MSVNLNTAAVTTLPRLSAPQAAGQLVKNSARALGGVSHNMMLNPQLLKRNSLIVSTLILVVSRIAIAFQSAKKAKGTEEESYRLKEAVKTTIREAGGWTLTYGFFRGVENLTRKVIRDYFGIEKQNYGLGLGDVYKEFGHAVRREKSPFAGVKPIEMVDNYVFDYANKARYDKIDGVVERVAKLFGGGKEEFASEAARKLSRMKAFYKWMPVIAATIPTVILSGVILERFTRDHADDMAEAVTSKWRVGFDPGTKGIQQNQIAYNAFFNRVGELQNQRLH